MSEMSSSLPLVFSVTGGVALLGLTLFTVVAAYRGRLPRCLRVLLAGVCVVGATGLTAFLTCHYGLRTHALSLAVGDQLLLAPYGDADLDSRLLQLFCHSLRISSDKPGLTVWTAAVAPNRATAYLYTLLLPVAEQPPTVIPLRLSAGDQFTVSTTPNDMQMAVYAHAANWREWETAGLHQEAHETCCAWWQLRPLRQTTVVEIETSGLHHIVLRRPPDAKADGVVRVAFNRSRFDAAVCDPVVCDAVSVNACRVDVFERPSILEIRVTEGSENDFYSLRIWIACEYKGWAVALFSSLVPVCSLAVIGCVAWLRHRRRLKGRRMDIASPVYAFPGLSPAGTGAEKEGVDFV